MLFLRISCLCILFVLGACSERAPLQNPELGSARDDVVQLKPDSFILMDGYPPQQFQDHWLTITTYTQNSSAALIEVSKTQKEYGERIEVQVGDTIPIGDARYEVLVIEEVDRRLAWVEIDSTPQP